MFWGNVVAIEIYAHRICQQLSSRKEGWRKEGRMWIWLWIYAHMCICIRICILDWLLLPFQRIICIFAFEIFAGIFLFLFCSSFLWLCPKNLIVNKNLPCGKFVMQTNEMRHKSRSEREGERDWYQLLFIISQLKLWESFVPLIMHAMLKILHWHVAI